MRKNILPTLPEAIASAAILCATICSGQSTNAEKPFVNGGNADFSFASKHLAGKAGSIFVDASVMQGYADISTKAGTFFAWSNARVNEKDINELDLGFVSPSLDIGPIGINASLAGYTYASSSLDWKQKDVEMGMTLSTKTLPFSANLYGGVNVSGKNTSGILKLSLKKRWALESISRVLRNTDLSLEGTTTYQVKYYSPGVGFSHATLRSEVSHAIGRHAEVYLSAVAQKKINSFGGRINDDLVGIVGARYKF